MKEVTTHPSHRGTGSTSAECILQPGTPQTPLCPCSDIVSLQVASHLLCLDPSPPSGCCWPELLSERDVGVSRASQQLWDTESSTSGWIQEVLDQGAELRLDAQKVWLTGFSEGSKSCLNYNKIELKKKYFLENILLLLIPSVLWQTPSLQLNHCAQKQFAWSSLVSKLVYEFIIRVTLIKNKRKFNYKVLRVHEVNISYLLI